MKKRQTKKNDTKKDQKKDKKKGSLSTIIFVVIFLVGLAIMLYPTVSNYINSKNQTKAIAKYDDTVAKMTKAERQAMLDEAVAYNEKLYSTGKSVYNPGSLKEYKEILDVSGTGIMGYISIGKIHVELPIYHGTSSSVLNIAAGHLEGTSFPIGGKSTHAVISAHRGLPSAKLFTNLDQLEVGDSFTITILGRMITYEVDQIHIVLPEQVEDLKVIDGRDYCTLMTCTPYGVNSHRLLVRGKRVPNAYENMSLGSDAAVIDPLVVAPIIATPVLIALVVVALSNARKHRKKKQLAASGADKLSGDGKGKKTEKPNKGDKRNKPRRRRKG